MRNKKQIEDAAGEYYRMNEAKNRNISAAALKSFKDGIKWADKHPENPWHPIKDLPKEPCFVIVWGKADTEDAASPESPFIARYCGEGYFDMFGLMFWTPLYWMPLLTPEMKPYDYTQRPK